MTAGNGPRALRRVVIGVGMAALAVAVLATGPRARGVETDDGEQTGATAAYDYGIRQVREINRNIRQGWQDYEITPSAPAGDGEWCRRVYLDVLGRVPSVEELQAFVSSKDPDK